MTSERPSNRNLCRFLADYSGALLGAGATCIRLTKNVNRMAERFGRRVEITIMPRHVHLSVLDTSDDELVTMIAPVTNGAISFNINTMLSQLSWDVHDRKLSLARAEEEFHRIVSSDNQRPWVVLLLASVANAAFCRLFGGDFAAMAIVFIATMAGYYLKQVLLKRHVDLRVTVTACAFVSSVLGASGILFSIGATPSVALGTSVLYLVPGIPFLNSFSDMLYNHYICAISRFIHATVLTCCLSGGLCLGMWLMNVGMF